MKKEKISKLHFSRYRLMSVIEITCIVCRCHKEVHLRKNGFGSTRKKGPKICFIDILSYVMKRIKTRG